MTVNSASLMGCHAARAAVVSMRASPGQSGPEQAHVEGLTRSDLLESPILQHYQGGQMSTEPKTATVVIVLSAYSPPSPLYMLDRRGNEHVCTAFQAVIVPHMLRNGIGGDDISALPTWRYPLTCSH